MYKTLSFVSALLVGLVSADKHRLMDYAKSNTYDLSVVKGSWGYSADFEYHFEYEGGPYTDSDAPAPNVFSYKKYGVYLQTNLDLLLTTTWMNWYQWNIDVSLKPFKVSPYNQWLIWYRPEASSVSDFDVDVYASTWCEILTLTSTIVEHAKTCKVSIWDYINDPKNENITPEDIDCLYDSNFEKKYDDKYWHYDLGSQALSADVVNKIIGEKAIYNYWLLSKYTW
jgi:hypothetical protein